jgi:hypothetical protein
MQKPAKTARWAKCLAISVLVGLSIGIFTIALSSFFFYRRYASQFPSDTQNVLSALSSAVVVGIGVGAAAAVGTAGIYLLLGLRGTDAETPSK